MSESNAHLDRLIVEQEKPKPPLRLRSLGNVKPQKIEWLWPDRIAVGKQTIIAGEPGLGKSQLTCWLAAQVSNGSEWPDGRGCAPKGSVIILSAEDDIADTIVPRLDAVDADRSKIHVIEGTNDGERMRGFNLQADLRHLEEAICKIGDVRLIVIDPISSYLGRVDSHKNAELRAVLEPLGQLASRNRVAIVSVTHLNKGARKSALNSVVGSIGFVAVARAAYLIARDPNDKDRRLFLLMKNNLGRDDGGLGFIVGAVETQDGILAPRAFFDDLPVTMTANDVLAAAGEGDTSAPVRSEAEALLQEVLATGPQPVSDIKREASEAGIGWRTIQRAKESLGVG